MKIAALMARAASAPLRTNLRAPTAFDCEGVKRRGYIDQGILVLSVDDPRLAWPERMILKQIADKIYGERRSN